MKDKEKVKVTTPFPLTEKQREILYEKLGRIIPEPFIIEEEIDPSLIGGIVVMWEELLIDCSIKTQLERLRGEILKEALEYVNGR